MRSRTVILAAALALAGCARHDAAEESKAWEPIALGTDAEFHDLWFADTLNGWIVGGSYQIDGGLIGRTRDGGRTWRFTSGLATPEPGVSRFGISSVRFLSERRGVVVGDGGKIFVTDDGGENWRLARYGRSQADHLFDLQFIDDWNGFAVGLGGVMRTRDGGEHWEDVVRSSSENGYLGGSAIWFHDAWSGWMIGQFGSVLHTHDGGATWTTVDVPLALTNGNKPHLRDITFVEGNGWIVGEEGTILHTSDWGRSWAAESTGIAGARSKPKLERLDRIHHNAEIDLGERTPGLQLFSVRFLDAQRGWIVGNFGYEARSVVLKTVDGGATWTVDAEVRGEDLRALFVIDADHAWAVGDRSRDVPQVILRRRALGGT